MAFLKKNPPATNPDGDMSVIEHLDELRTRIIISLVAWALASVGVWYFSHMLLDVVLAPLHARGVEMNVSTLQGAFMTYLKIAIICGGFLASPVMLWQLVLFVLPALTGTEKRALLAVVPFGIILFAGGVAFSLTLVLPTAVKFLLSFTGAEMKPLIMAESYLSFVSSLALMCGLIFEMPLILLFLAFIGLVNGPMLSRYRRYAYFACFALSAVMTPTPDAFTMVIVALPMLLLYEISIILVRIFKPRETETVVDAE